MCWGGPSEAEKAIAADTEAFDSVMQKNYNTLFQSQMGVLNHVDSVLNPITSAGPNQMGMSGKEFASRQADIVATTGAAATSAAQAARLYGAGEGGGGTSGLTSGIQAQINAAIGTKGAMAEAGELNALNIENAAIGRENFWRAQGAEQALANQYSPNAAMSGAISEGGQAFSEADKINQEQQAAEKAKFSTIAGLAMDAATFGAGGFAALGAGESFGEGMSDFMKGGFNQLSGSDIFSLNQKGANG